jgi:addiction module HigA family antidote
MENTFSAYVWRGRRVVSSVEITDYPLKEKLTNKLSSVYPSGVLLEELIGPMGLGQNRPAIDIGVDARRTNEIVPGKRAITADTVLRVSRFFGNSPQFWMGLQSQYDLDIAQDQLRNGLDREVRPYAMAG